MPMRARFGPSRSSGNPDPACRLQMPGVFIPSFRTGIQSRWTGRSMGRLTAPELGLRLLTLPPIPHSLFDYKCLVYISHFQDGVGQFEGGGWGRSCPAQQSGPWVCCSSTIPATLNQPIDYKYKCLVYSSRKLGSGKSVSRLGRGMGLKYIRELRFGPVRSPSRPRTRPSSANAWCILSPLSGFKTGPLFRGLGRSMSV